MSNLLDLPQGDDDILFADDDGEERVALKGYWEALIVDDDLEVHNVTKLALEDFVFDDKGLTFVSAHSAKEARQKIAEHPDTAVILLDVVMEDDEAGLRFVEELRGEMGNQLVRVILRTGQPGQAPERRVIVDYDINDYKTKPELTSQKLFTSMVSALRSWRDLVAIQRAKEELSDLNATLEQRVEDRTKDLRSAQAQLVQASKMASLGSLVAGVAHEINTPIASVSSSQATLQKAIAKMRSALDDASGANSKVLSYMTIVEQSSSVIELGATRVAEIVQRLRRFARLDEAALQRVDINECVRDALALAESALAGIEVTTELGDVPSITCYPDRLNQVLFNIVTNAAEVLGDAGHLKLSVVADGDGVRITVADDGPGIPEEHLERVFDPGFTTKMGGIGTGLGLAIAYQVIGDHGGEIRATSGPGQGTAVIIRLPSAPPQNRTRASAPS